MRAPLQLTGSIRSKTRLNQWAHLGILAALGSVLFFEARLLLTASGVGVSPSQMLAQATQAHLQEVSSAITSYLQNHDTTSLERIKGEGKEASRLLDQLKERLSVQGEGRASARIEQVHEGVREATLNLLAADHDVVKTRQALAESNDALASVLAQMQSSIKSNQLNSSARLRALRVASAEANTLSKNDARFKKAVASYEELSRTRRAARWVEQAQSNFEQGVSRANDLDQAEGKKRTALVQFGEKRKMLDKALQEIPSDLPEGKAGLAYVVLNGALILAGAFLVLGAYRRTDREFAGPLQDILQCVEAASAGDTSRLPEHWSGDEVGQLSQATGRLISVLARSENLIYHLAALVESSGDAIISHTLEGKILSWNKGAQRIYGYSAEEVKGQSIVMLSPDDAGAEMMQNLKRIRDGERLKPFETLHQARNGRQVHTFVRAAAIYDSTHKIIGASFVAQDLSDTHLLQSKAIERNQTA